MLKTAYAVIDAASGNLLVIGTSGADNIVVNTTNPLNVTVEINGVYIPNPDPLSGGIFMLPNATTNRVIVFTLNGTDYVSTPGYRMAEVHCGTGNDRVYGSYVNDVLIGGGGSNLFVGNGGNDVIEMGLNRNTVQATGTGNSLMIAGQVTGTFQVYDQLRYYGDLWAANPSSANLSPLVAAVTKPNVAADQDVLSGGTGADAYFLRSIDLVANYSAAKGDKKFTF